jgi:hypothetical protein
MAAIPAPTILAMVSSDQVEETRRVIDAHVQTEAVAPMDNALAAVSRSIKSRRIGRNTNHASNAAAMFMPAATMNTACQLPLAAVSTLESGTSSDAVPFAV